MLSKPTKNNKTGRTTNTRAEERRTGTGIKKTTADEMLEYEIDRLQEYIPKKSIKNIITKKDAEKAIKQLGQANDPVGALKNIPKYATKKTIKEAANKLWKEHFKKNLTDAIKFKNNKLVKGIKAGPDTFIKLVSYKRGDKIISYPQARNITTGKIVSLTKALRRIR